MKNLAIVGLFGLIFLVSGGLSQDKDCPVFQLIVESITACRAEFGDETFKLLEENPRADSEEIKCFKACAMKKGGIMKDAKIDMEKVKEIGSKAKDKQVGFGLVTLAQSCQQESEVSDNECEVAGRYYNCYMTMKEQAEAP